MNGGHRCHLLYLIIKTQLFYPFCRTTPPNYSMGPFFPILFLSLVSIIVTLVTLSSLFFAEPPNASRPDMPPHVIVRWSDQNQTSARQTNGRNTSRAPKKNLHSVGSQQPATWYQRVVKKKKKCHGDTDMPQWLNNGNQRMITVDNSTSNKLLELFYYYY